MNFPKLLISALLVCIATAVSHAQFTPETSYTATAAVCGQASTLAQLPPFNCGFAVSPGTEPTGLLTNPDMVLSLPQSYIGWGDAPGPSGAAMGGAVISSANLSYGTVCVNGECSVQPVSMTLAFSGVYCPCTSGENNGTYSGTASFAITYRVVHTGRFGRTIAVQRLFSGVVPLQ